MTEHDQVERLKAQLENLSESHLGQRVLIAAMGEERDGMVKLVEQATTEIERLRDQVARLSAERDEARREAATFYARQFYKEDAVDRMSRIYAEECGWDCFKEDKEDTDD